MCSDQCRDVLYGFTKQLFESVDMIFLNLIVPRACSSCKKVEDNMKVCGKCRTIILFYRVSKEMLAYSQRYMRIV